MKYAHLWFRAQIFSLTIVLSLYMGIYKMCTCHQVGFQPYHNSKYVWETTLVRTRFDMYTPLLSINRQRFRKDWSLLCRLHPMSKKMLSFLNLLHTIIWVYQAYVSGNEPMLLKKLCKWIGSLSILTNFNVAFSILYLISLS